jgi:hypothetical protein
MEASFSPEYAFHLGFNDGKEYGTKHPQRSFDRNATDERNKAYFIGLKAGIEIAQHDGLDMRCLVCWDKPSLNHENPCLGHASYVGFAFNHVIPICERHAFKLYADLLTSKDKNEKLNWCVLPIGWV